MANYDIYTFRVPELGKPYIDLIHRTNGNIVRLSNLTDRSWNSIFANLQVSPHSPMYRDMPFKYFDDDDAQLPF